MSDHFPSAADGWLETVHHPRLRLLHRRRRERHVLRIDSRVVPGDQIPPAVRATLNRVCVMLATRPNLQQLIGRPVRLVVAVTITVTQQSLATHDQ